MANDVPCGVKVSTGPTAANPLGRLGALLEPSVIRKSTGVVRAPAGMSACAAAPITVPPAGRPRVGVELWATTLASPASLGESDESARGELPSAGAPSGLFVPPSSWF